MICSSLSLDTMFLITFTVYPMYNDCLYGFVYTICIALIWGAPLRCYLRLECSTIKYITTYITNVQITIFAVIRKSCLGIDCCLTIGYCLIEPQFTLILSSFLMRGLLNHVSVKIYPQARLLHTLICSADQNQRQAQIKASRRNLYRPDSKPCQANPTQPIKNVIAKIQRTRFQYINTLSFIIAPLLLTNFHHEINYCTILSRFLLGVTVFFGNCLNVGLPISKGENLTTNS